MVKMKLHMLLAEHGITQKQLSTATGIRQGTISSYASNNFKHLVRNHINILCTYFNCDVSDLIQFKKD
jgi:putative transcriptional regulator